jgi:hypothetical protein
MGADGHHLGGTTELAQLLPIAPRWAWCSAVAVAACEVIWLVAPFSITLNLWMRTDGARSLGAQAETLHLELAHLPDGVLPLWNWHQVLLFVMAETEGWRTAGEIAVGLLRPLDQWDP